MRTLVAAIFAALLGALALATGASGSLAIGVVDDHPVGQADGGAAFFGQMNDIGLTQVRVTVLWDHTAPTTIPHADEISRLLPVAASRGVKVVFAVYPLRPRGLTSSATAPARFTAFVAQLARTFPQVTDVIVGNEPNQTRFWQPQFRPDGSSASCVAFEKVLASSYDALKSVNPAINVVGVGLSPRGNDDPKAPSNISHSPVNCLRHMGLAYRGSARRKPIMDEFSFHPYPNSARDPLLRGYRWPNAGVPDLNRIKQAFWDAFHGTGQPTFGERGARGRLAFRLDEVGWQVGVVASARAAYDGRENVEVTDEASQAKIYGELVRYLACDASVESLLFFGLVDEANLDRWQAGLVRADGSRRPAYDSVKRTFAATRGRCLGGHRSWRHVERVIGAGAKFPRHGRFLPARHLYWAFNATAEENATYRAGIFPARLPRSAIVRALARGGGVLRAKGLVNAYWTPLVKFPGRTLGRGNYVYAIHLAAEMNPGRTSTFVSRPFRVGDAGAR